MSVLFIMVPVALLLATAAIAGFIWAAREGQFDDTDTPPHRVLFDDEQVLVNQEEHKRKENC